MPNEAKIDLVADPKKIKLGIEEARKAIDKFAADSKKQLEETGESAEELEAKFADIAKSAALLVVVLAPPTAALTILATASAAVGLELDKTDVKITAMSEGLSVADEIIKQSGQDIEKLDSILKEMGITAEEAGIKVTNSWIKTTEAVGELIETVGIKAFEELGGKKVGDVLTKEADEWSGFFRNIFKSIKEQVKRDLKSIADDVIENAELINKALGGTGSNKSFSEIQENQEKINKLREEQQKSSIDRAKELDDIDKEITRQQIENIELISITDLKEIEKRIAAHNKLKQVLIDTDKFGGDGGERLGKQAAAQERYNKALAAVPKVDIPELNAEKDNQGDIAAAQKADEFNAKKRLELLKEYNKELENIEKTSAKIGIDGTKWLETEEKLLTLKKAQEEIDADGREIAAEKHMTLRLLQLTLEEQLEIAKDTTRSTKEDIALRAKALIDIPRLQQAIRDKEKSDAKEAADNAAILAKRKHDLIEDEKRQKHELNEIAIASEERLVKVALDRGKFSDEELHKIRLQNIDDWEKRQLATTILIDDRRVISVQAEKDRAREVADFKELLTDKERKNEDIVQDSEETALSNYHSMVLDNLEKQGATDKIIHEHRMKFIADEAELRIGHLDDNVAREAAAAKKVIDLEAEKSRFIVAEREKAFKIGELEKSIEETKQDVRDKKRMVALELEDASEKKLHEERMKLIDEAEKRELTKHLSELERAQVIADAKKARIAEVANFDIEEMRRIDKENDERKKKGLGPLLKGTGPKGMLTRKDRNKLLQDAAEKRLNDIAAAKLAKNNKARAIKEAAALAKKQKIKMNAIKQDIINADKPQLGKPEKLGDILKEIAVAAKKTNENEEKTLVALADVGALK